MADALRASTQSGLSLRNFGPQSVDAASSMLLRHQIIDWFFTRFDLNDEITVSVNEVVCTTPGCAPLQTIVAVYAEGAARRFRFDKPLMAMRETDVFDLDPHAKGATSADLCC